MLQGMLVVFAVRIVVNGEALADRRPGTLFVGKRTLGSQALPLQRFHDMTEPFPRTGIS